MRICEYEDIVDVVESVLEWAIENKEDRAAAMQCIKSDLESVVHHCYGSDID